MHNDKTAVIYCRVSTARQADEELPLQSQQQRCEDKARTLDATVLRVYADEGISGQSDHRPAFQQAILYCETHSPTYLITWSTSRFARNRLDAQLYKRRLAKAGTTLAYASMDIDRETDGGWLTEGILELFDEFTSKQIAADTRRSMIKAAQSGYWCGGHPPFGYRSVPALDDPKRRRLDIVPEEAAVVRQIFTLRAQGIGAHSLAETLNREGQFNRTHRWNKTSLLTLLRNRAMIGQIAFGKVITADGEKRRAPPEDWVIVPAHLPIIDRPLWDTVQRMLDADALNTQAVADNLGRGSPHSTHLFTGLLRCGVCGASLQIETAKGRSRRYRYYNCRDAQRKGGCPPRRLPARELDDWLLEVVCGDLFTPTNLRQAVQDLHEIAGRWHDERIARRQATEKQLQDVKRRNSKLYEVLEEFGRDAPHLGDLAQRLRENHAQIKKLETKLRDIDAEEPPTLQIEDDDLVEMAALLVEALKTRYNPAQTRALLADFIQQIVVEGATVRIEYDPRRLIAAIPTAGVHTVPSTSNWLPGPPVPGILTRRIPAAALPHKAPSRRHHA